MIELAPLLQAPYWSQGERVLTCTARIDETRDGDTVTASTFHFQTLPQASRFHYLPGQFLLLAVEIDGQTQHRAYSLCSSPTRPHTLAVTIKRVPGGKVSNYLIDTLQPGMTLRATPPQGNFHLPARLPAELVLLSAGSGITPMLAISRALQDLGMPCRIHFVHSARHAGDVIALDELQALATLQGFRLTLLLETPSDTLACLPGRLDSDRLAAVTAGLTDYQLLLCGPAGYLEAVHQLLDNPRYAGVPVAEEQFSPATSSTDPGQVETGDQRDGYALRVPAFGTDSQIAADETLLDALEREGLPIIGACRAGVCGSCKCKVEQGEVESTSQLALTPDQIADGYVLACSSKARSDVQVSLG